MAFDPNTYKACSRMDEYGAKLRAGRCAGSEQSAGPRQHDNHDRLKSARLLHERVVDDYLDEGDNIQGLSPTSVSRTGS